MNVLKGIKRRIQRHLALCKRYKDKDTIFIYQMGKVGSTTLENSIPNALHVHAFYNANHTCPIRQYGIYKFGFLHYFYRVEQEILSYIIRYIFKKRKNTKIITLVREPVSRNISMFFHDIDAYLFAATTNCMNSRKKTLSTRSQEGNILVDVFNQEFNHDYVLDWFDKEFLPMTGIDIYSYEFNSSIGYSRIQENNVEVLCLNIKKLSSSINILNQFTGSPITLLTSNYADEKWYSHAYQEFKVSYSPPEAYQLKVKKSKYYNHFFRG